MRQYYKKAEAEGYGLQSDHRGMSFIEMVVVVLIVGILSAGLIANVGIVKSRNADNCADRLIGALEKARQETMSRAAEDVQLKLYEREGSFYGAVSRDKKDGEAAEETEIHLGGSDVDILINGASLEDKSVALSFDRASGSFKENDMVFQSGTGEIRIQGRQEVRIVLVQRTGRSYVEEE